MTDDSKKPDAHDRRRRLKDDPVRQRIRDLLRERRRHHARGLACHRPGLGLHAPVPGDRRPQGPQDGRPPRPRRMARLRSRGVAPRLRAPAQVRQNAALHASPRPIFPERRSPPSPRWPSRPPPVPALSPRTMPPRRHAGTCRRPCFATRDAPRRKTCASSARAATRWNLSSAEGDRIVVDLFLPHSRHRRDGRAVGRRRPRGQAGRDASPLRASCASTDLRKPCVRALHMPRRRSPYRRKGRLDHQESLTHPRTVAGQAGPLPIPYPPVAVGMRIATHLRAPILPCGGRCHVAGRPILSAESAVGSSGREAQ